MILFIWLLFAHIFLGLLAYLILRLNSGPTQNDEEGILILFILMGFILFISIVLVLLEDYKEKIDKLEK